MRNALSGLLTLAATSAAALQPLHLDPVVMNGFYSIGLADEVRKNCETIDARLISAWSYLKSIERHAKEAGYSDEEISAFRKNAEEKARLKTRIETDLAARGAAPETPEGYCTVGLEEIAKGSDAGKLLRAR